MILITCAFCSFNSLLGYIWIQDCREQIKGQYRKAIIDKAEIKELKQEVKMLRQEVEEQKQEHEVITDCLLNGRWN